MSVMESKTVIIGAGISGLSCARHLSSNDEDFLLISKDIGGRILTSDDGNSNYGAFFVCSDYDHVLKYVTLDCRIRLRDFCFHGKTKQYILFSPRLLAYISQFVKMQKILYTFRKKLRLLRKNSVFISQKQAIESDPFLLKLYMQTASDFINEYQLEKGTEVYFSKALYSTTFSKIHEMNAFSFVQFLLPLITPIYTFKFEKERMVEPFKDRIIIGEVNHINFKDKQYKIMFDNKIVYAKNLVLATQINWSKQYANVTKTNKPIDTNMMHIKGSPIMNFSNKNYHLFHPSSNVQAIANLKDGTFLVYYKKDTPDLNQFFNNSSIIASKQWDPAGFINGHTLIESNRGNNMYLIGDYNIAGLEEAYITGLYCANQIVQNR